MNKFINIGFIGTLLATTLAGCMSAQEARQIQHDRQANRDPHKMQCKHEYYQKVRLGSQYRFHNWYSHGNSFNHTLLKTITTFQESDDINGDGKATYAEHFINAPAGTVIPPSTKEQNYEFSGLPDNLAYKTLNPPKKRHKDNIVINYMVLFKTPNGTQWQKDCVHYEVTWFGDGIVDKDDGETCDIADPKREGWVNGQCLPPKK